MTTHAEPVVEPRTNDIDYPLATCKHCKETIVVIDAAFEVGGRSRLRWFHFHPRTWYCTPEDPAALAVASQKDNTAGHERE